MNSIDDLINFIEEELNDTDFITAEYYESLIEAAKELKANMEKNNVSI